MRHRDLVEQNREEVEGRRINPVQVLHDEQHWLARGHSQQDRDHRLQRLLPLPLGAHRRQRIAIGGREREEGRE